MTNLRPTSEQDNAIVNLVDRILIKAIEDRTSYLYFEPQAQSLQIRVRQDGRLKIGLQNLPHKIVAPTIEYLKSIAQIDPELPAPQTGIINQTDNFSQVRIEITTLPTQFGDSIGAKIIYVQQPPLSLDQLVANRATFESISQLIQSDRGLVLFIGEQDSDKSAAIEASLAEISRSDRNIYTIDCQSKYPLPGVNQITLPAHASDETIIRTVQACLDQDPDVLAIGAIDRLPLAEIALQAVANGCLVFATIQAATAGKAIAHLRDLGIPTARLYTATIGIISQKLIDGICLECRLPDEPNSLKLDQIGSTILSLNHRHQYYRANSLSLGEIEPAKQTGKLCPNCQGSGYGDRIGIHEVLILTDRLKPTIISGDAEYIDLAAQETGMPSFLDSAIRLFRAGKITLSAVQRCVPPKTLLQNHLANAETYPEDPTLDLDRAESLEVALYWKRQATKAQSQHDHLLGELTNYQQASDKFEQRIKHSRSQVEQGTRTEIALQLLSVVDVIELARNSIKPQTDRETAIYKGYSMLENKMLSSIREIGVQVTESKGHKFNPHLHEVVQEIGTHDCPAGVVISELKRGYTLGDRVLRLAQVKVAVASSFV